MWVPTMVPLRNNVIMGSKSRHWMKQKSRSTASRTWMALWGSCSKDNILIFVLTCVHVFWSVCVVRWETRRDAWAMGSAAHCTGPLLSRSVEQTRCRDNAHIREFPSMHSHVYVCSDRRCDATSVNMHTQHMLCIYRDQTDMKSCASKPPWDLSTKGQIHRGRSC